MTSTFKSAMLAAAQLTAAGDLNAATAAIQRALAGAGAVASTSAAPAATAASPGFTVGSPWSGRGGDDVIDVDAHWIADDAEHKPHDTAAPRSHAAGSADAGSADAGTPATPSTGAQRPASVGGQADGGQGSTLAGAFGNAAGRREYLLYLPRSVGAATAGLPLVVMLHGCTQTPADFAAGTAMSAFAEQHGFLVLYPGQGRAANQSSCWNWFNPGDQRADGGEPSIITGMAREVIARYQLDQSRVYVAGLSAGGAMAAILANAYPELFAAVAVHSGLPAGAAHDLPSALSAMKRGASSSAAAAGPRHTPSGKTVRTIVFHGRQDRTVHPSNASQIINAALHAWPNGALAPRQETGRAPGGRSFTRTIHRDAAGTPMVEQWEVQGAGHAWSGGSPRGTYTDPQGPDASAAMMTFFLAR